MSCGVHRPMEDPKLGKIARVWLFQYSKHFMNMIPSRSKSLSPSKIHHFLLRKHLETGYSTILFGILLDPHETIRHQLNRSFWDAAKALQMLWYVQLYHSIPFYTILYHSIPFYTILIIPFYTIVYPSISFYINHCQSIYVHIILTT